MARLVTRLASISSSISSSVLARTLLLSVVVALAGGCAPDDVEHLESRTRAVTAASADPGNLDILFMIDNSSSMTQIQQKLLDQDPSFMTVLQNLPHGLPNIHVAVVSSDMGAPGDSTSSIQCTTAGDNGLFQSTPRGTCTNTMLASGATFISNVDGVANYTGNLTDVFGCIAQLGQRGCGFENQLASVARALGADGAPPPTNNVGFLRDDAELAIVLLTNEDDCSAPRNTTIFSLNGAQQNVANPLGPIANYRCNQFGHLCTDPASVTPSALISPPLKPPTDAQGTSTAPTLNLTNCESNDTGTGLLTPVASLIAGIKALKADPDNQIVVGAISPPATPYTVAWLPPSGGGQNTQPGELWPLIEHSCGALGFDDVNPLATQNPTDGSFGDPGVRIAQWVHAFGANGVVTSICDADYSVSFQSIADKISMHLYGTGSGGAGGAGGIIGGVGGAGGHGNVGGTSGAGGAAGSGVAGNGGPGTGGAAGTGGAGNAGSGTGGAGAGGAGGNGANAGAAGGHAGAGGQSSTGGVSGAAGMGGAAAGASGTGTGGAATAGASGTGTGGAATAGASGSGTGGAGGGGATTGTGTGGAAGAGTNGTGGGAAAGASGAGAGGAAGQGETGGHAGNGTGTGGAGTAGTGGTTEGASSGGCSCDTGGSSPTGPSLALLLGALALVANRRRAARVAASSPGR